MSTVHDFENLDIWKLSRELVIMIYSDFNLGKDPVFKNQITAAGI